MIGWSFAFMEYVERIASATVLHGCVNHLVPLLRHPSLKPRHHCAAASGMMTALAMQLHQGEARHRGCGHADPAA